MTFHFANPLAFAALAAIPLWALVALWRHRHAPAVRTPVLHRALHAASFTRRTPAAWLPPIARAAALACLVYALARPQLRIPHAESIKDAIALELVVDRSGSMDEPVEFEGHRTKRLDAVKQVVRRFVLGDDHDLKGRAGDLIGLIVFGSYADTLVPLTTSHQPLVDTLDRITVATDQRERSTAIGDALVLANARLRAAEQAMKNDTNDPDFELKSKAIVLLTDGENRDGVYSPADAAKLAAEWGNKVYIIGIRGGASQLFGGIRQRIGQEVNEREMASVAEYTGGKFWPVNDVADLPDVYARIDELERTRIRTNESTEIRELYHTPAAAGVALLAAELLLATLAGARRP